MHDASVRGWREHFVEHEVEARSIDHFAAAMLPKCFSRKEPIAQLSPEVLRLARPR